MTFLQISEVEVVWRESRVFSLWSVCRVQRPDRGWRTALRGGFPMSGSGWEELRTNQAPPFTRNQSLHKMDAADPAMKTTLRWITRGKASSQWGSVHRVTADETPVSIQFTFWNQLDCNRWSHYSCVVVITPFSLSTTAALVLLQ